MDFSTFFDTLFEYVEGFKGFTDLLTDFLAMVPSIFVTAFTIFFVVLIFTGLVKWILSLL